MQHVWHQTTGQGGGVASSIDGALSSILQCDHWVETKDDFSTCYTDLAPSSPNKKVHSNFNLLMCPSGSIPI